ncbi:MAG: glutamine synthetase family protein [Actinomycetota bacterium]|nr:glutamine synthetase family protein [Actinomycetota bacterium]
MPVSETGAAETLRGPGSPREYVLLGMPDVNGSLRGKAFRRDAFEAALRDGTVMTDLLLALDPVDTPITDYESFGIRSGAGDLVVHPDVDTLGELTWRAGWSVCLGTPSWRDGRRCDLAPREVLRNALAAMADLGYDVMAAFEYEVRLRDGEGEPLSSGISYSLAEIGRYEELVSSLSPALAALGVELDAIHTEAGPGLVELNLAARRGLRAADDAAFVKLAVKEVAASLGLRASFLAKTVAGEEGSSGHVHLSFWSDGANAFAPDDPGGALPAPAAAAVAGMLDHLAGASLVLNPTINSYKRLVPGWFAPVNATWGIENRSAAIRAISAAKPERCRLECRRPGADANPYLALAALVVSAADGIRREAEPPPSIEGDASEREDVPPLPGSLEAALAAFRADAKLRAGLGESFSDYYAISRQWELRAWRESVSDWERERYDRAV